MTFAVHELKQEQSMVHHREHKMIEVVNRYSTADHLEKLPAKEQFRSTANISFFFSRTCRALL